LSCLPATLLPELNNVVAVVKLQIMDEVVELLVTWKKFYVILEVSMVSHDLTIIGFMITEN